MYSLFVQPIAGISLPRLPRNGVRRAFCGWFFRFSIAANLAASRSSGVCLGSVRLRRFSLGILLGLPFSRRVRSGPSPLFRLSLPPCRLSLRLCPSLPRLSRLRFERSLLKSGFSGFSNISPVISRSTGIECSMNSSISTMFIA